MNFDLTRPVSIEEIKLAAHQLGPLKSPGEDGFPGLFYIKFWEIISEVVQNAAIDFFTHGNLLRAFNKTQIVLIPKTP